MAKLTPLDVADAKQLGRRYGLTVERLELLEQGSVNTNFRVTDRSGKSYFGRIYEEQDERGASCELGLLRELARAGVPTTPPLPTLSAAAERAPEYVSEFRGKPVAFYPWIDGDIVCQRRVTPGHVAAVGRALALVHRASGKVSGVPRGRFEPGDLRRRLERVQRERSEFEPIARDIGQRLECGVRARDETLPKGLIHADLFRDNVLFRKPLAAAAIATEPEPVILALIDFESACQGYFVFDLLVCVHAWCYGDQFDLDLVAALVRGYQAVRPLEPRERAGYRVEGALAALRFAVTRITDFSLRAAPGEPPARDYRRFLARLEQLEQGVLDQVLHKE